MRVPLYVPRVSKSLSPATSKFAFARTAHSRNISSLGSRHTFADALAADPHATAVVVGYSNVDERLLAKHRKTSPSQYAALRAVNTKAYLVEEKSIDPRRIEVRTGTEDAKEVILWLVPTGATLDMNDTVRVDEPQVKSVPRYEVHRARS